MSSGPAGPASGQDGDVVLRLVLADRSTAELQLTGADAAVLEPHLNGAAQPVRSPDEATPLPPMSPPSTPRGRVAIVFLIVGLLWTTAMLLPAVTGYAATATVLGGDGEGFCDVIWQAEDGATLRGESDCSDETEGTSFPIWVSGWPLDPEPATPGLVLSLALVIGLPVVGGAALRLVQLRRRRRPPAAGPLHVPLPEAPAASVNVPPQVCSALSVEATAAAVAKGLRRAWAVVAVGAASGVALVALWSVLDRVDAEFMASAVRASGTIVALEPDSRFDAGSASVRFTVDGVSAVRSVSLGGLVEDYVEGQDVTVFYDPRERDRVTIDDIVFEPVWAPWVMGPLLSALVLGPFGVWLVVANRRMRVLLSNRTWRSVGVRAFQGDRRVWFITSDGAIWRSQVDGDADWLSSGGAFSYQSLPAVADESAWWVSDGEAAVFSPDEGNTLVRARRRPTLPWGVRRAVAKARAKTG